MERARGHRQLEHTADLCIEAWGPSEELALAESARALVGWICEEAAIYEQQEERVTVEGALDKEDRLVRFLNEVLNLALSRGFLTADAAITLHGATGLEATLRGEAGAGAKVSQELKSVTYHDLHLDERADGSVCARFVVDV